MIDDDPQRSAVDWSEQVICKVMQGDDYEHVLEAAPAWRPSAAILRARITPSPCDASLDIGGKVAVIEQLRVPVVT